jgi:superfamily II DNA helicase RecQ
MANPSASSAGAAVRGRVTPIGTDAMARKVRRVPVSLDSSAVSPLSDEEIRTILRGADDLIMSGGRSLLARVLKGSKQKGVLEKELDRSPVYGVMRELSIDEITRRVDWMIEEGYLAIEYDYRLPLLKYTDLGWAIERDIYAAELLGRLDREIEQGVEAQDIGWLTERHPQVLELVVERISRSGDRKYLPFLRRWKSKASRRLGRQIQKAIEALHQLS